MTEHNPHLRRTLVALLLGCALAAGSTATASAAVLKADYGFSGDLTSSVLPAPDLVQVGNCLTPNDFATETVNLVADPVLVFNAGCGLQLDTSTLVAPGSWSLALLFRFSDVTAFRRVFDATPGLTDHGLYVHNGALDFNIGFNQEGPTQPIATDQYAQVVLTRDAATQELDGYVNGELQFSVSDALGDALLTSAQTPRFLIDDAGEDSAGAVSRVRLYDAPLTAAEVAALDGNPPTDVSIATTSDIDPAYVGGSLGYTFAVSVTGPDASGVVVSDPLPAGVDFVSASPGCSVLDRVVTCDVGTVSSGAPATLHIVVRPTAVNPALSNTATATSTPPDPNPANDSSTATTDVQPPADIAVAMTRDVADAAVGQTFGYTVTITNHGPAAAHAIVLTDPLSADVDFVSASAGCVANAGTLTCDVGDLASGATVTRRIVVRPTAPDPQLLNTATVASPTGDVNLDNNFATTFTNVHPPPGPLVAAPAPAPTATPPGASAPAPPPLAAVVAPPPQAVAKALGKPIVAKTTRRGLLRRGLRFTQRVPTAGRVRWTLTLPASGKAKAVVLGSATRTLTRPGTVHVTLKLSSAGRRRLAGKHPARLTLRTSLQAAGQSRHATTTVVVRVRG